MRVLLAVLEYRYSNTGTRASILGTLLEDARVVLGAVLGQHWSKKKNGPRKKAKEKLEYWLSLGELLAMMAQRYGIGIILLLPKKLTDKE